MDLFRRRWMIKIGLHSPKGPTWAQMGRSTIRAILNSARGVDPNDINPQAVKARFISGFGDLNGMIFVIRVGIEKDLKGEERNSMDFVIEPNHKEYARIMGNVQAYQPAVNSNRPAPAQGNKPFPQSNPTKPMTGRPDWA